MSLSRLSGLVTVLVLGTALSVWWYLQVPVAAASTHRSAEPLAVEELEEPGACESGLSPAPDSIAAPESERWTKRVRSAGAATGTRRTRTGVRAAGVRLEEAGTERPCTPPAACSSEPAAAAVEVPGT